MMMMMMMMMMMTAQPLIDIIPFHGGVASNGEMASDSRILIGAGMDGMARYSHPQMPDASLLGS